MKRLAVALALVLLSGGSGAWCAEELRCIPETATPLYFVHTLDTQWADVVQTVFQAWTRKELPPTVVKELSSRIRGLETAGGRAGRPFFCFGWEPRVVVTPQGPMRLLATYDAKTGRVDVSLTPEELASDGWCVVRHEMLHALVGGDEALVRSLQECHVDIAQEEKP